MTCLETLIGLKGGCAEISTDADLYLDSKVTRSELESYIDQNQYDDADALFMALRKQAVREVVDGVSAHFSSSFIHRTVVDQQHVGKRTLTADAAVALLKGVKFSRCSDTPSLAYRITRLGFFGAHTGNITVTYYDGLSGYQLATDTIAAVGGEHVELDVNRLARVDTLLIVFDVTAVDGYKATLCSSDCYNCPGKWRLNGHVNAQGMTSAIGTPLTQTIVDSTGGLTVDVAMECDSEGWMCGIRQQMAMPVLFKTSELAMEYATFNTSRENTRTTRDIEHLKDRHRMYREQFNAAMENVLNTIVLPNDPVCFHCKRTNRVAVAIP